LIKYAEKKAVKTSKVKIIRVIHNKKYGFFFLLSNLSLVGYFNNGKIIKFTPSLLENATSNE
jgi:hypothetical protein